MCVGRAEVGAYPEIDHSVVQPGVLVDGGSSLLRENKNTSHQPFVYEIFSAAVPPVWLPGKNLRPKTGKITADNK